MSVIIHATGTEMTRYDLLGEVLARARATPEGWVITDRDGGYSQPIADEQTARQQLSAWDWKAAALATLLGAALRHQQTRRDLEVAIQDAHAAGVPQTRIAEAAGFTRQWIARLLQSPPADTERPSEDQRSTPP